MIHRAVLGSIERFIAILLEHTAGRLPLWPRRQVRVVPVSGRWRVRGPNRRRRARRASEGRPA
jgi:threonyl-tRNA synthetase